MADICQTPSESFGTQMSFHTRKLFHFWMFCAQKDESSSSVRFANELPPCNLTRCVVGKSVEQNLYAQSVPLDMPPPQMSGEIVTQKPNMWRKTVQTFWRSSVKLKGALCSPILYMLNAVEIIHTSPARLMAYDSTVVGRFFMLFIAWTIRVLSRFEDLKLASLIKIHEAFLAVTTQTFLLSIKMAVWKLLKSKGSWLQIRRQRNWQQKVYLVQNMSFFDKKICTTLDFLLDRRDSCRCGIERLLKDMLSNFSTLRPTAAGAKGFQNG